MSTSKREKLEAALKRVRKAYHQRIVAELRDTELTYGEIAESVGVSPSLVYLVNRLSRCRPEPEQMVGEKE
jgi:DNA-binding HxlR family transcriptional regulator